METTIIYTSAPAAYDYTGVTREVDANAGLSRGQKVFRKVEIDTRGVDSQIQRYGSGLYAVLDERQFNEWVEQGLINPVEVISAREHMAPSPRDDVAEAGGGSAGLWSELDPSNPPEDGLYWIHAVGPEYDVDVDDAGQTTGYPTGGSVDYVTLVRLEFELDPQGRVKEIHIDRVDDAFDPPPDEAGIQSLAPVTPPAPPGPTPEDEPVPDDDSFTP